jgi:ABC-2 type transport system permease protein
LPAIPLYLRLTILQVRCQMQYRFNFALSLLGTFLFTTLDFAAILIVFHNIQTLAGWSLVQVALLYSSAAVSFALADIVVGGLDRLPDMIRDGTFDTLLLRPRSTFFLLLTRDFMIGRAGRLIQAAGVLVVVAQLLNVYWSPARVAVLIAAVLSGAVIMGAIWVIAACVAFWAVDSGEFVNTFTTGALFVAQYPAGIFTGWMRRGVVFVVPVAFVIYLPATYLLGKRDALGIPIAARLASPAVALAVAAVAAYVWRFAVKRYRSGGG